MSKFAVLISIFFSCISYSGGLNTINVFSGSPQLSDEWGYVTTGFGDIAANLVSAIEIKRRHPEKTVRLLVTSAEQRVHKEIQTTNEILKIMAPQLNPNNKNTVQLYSGIEVIFLDFDFGPILKEPHPLIMKRLVRKMKIQIQNIVPSSDANITFSYYEGSHEILRYNTSIAIGVEEQYGGRKFVNDAKAATGNNESPFIELASGPKSMGFVFAKNQRNSTANLDLIRQWIESNNESTVQKDLNPVMVYSSSWTAEQIYLYAIAEMQKNERKPLTLFVKYFSELDISILPKNIHVVMIKKGLPHHVMKALIEESTISPLVTGDISLGIALNSTNQEKVFIYETAPWKIETASGLRSVFAKSLNAKPTQLSSMFQVTEKISKATKNELHSEGLKLASFLQNTKFIRGIDRAIKENLEGWDAIGNTLKVSEEFLGLRSPGPISSEYNLKLLEPEEKISKWQCFKDLLGLSF